MLSSQRGEATQLMQQESLLGTLLEVLSQDKSTSQQSIIRQGLVQGLLVAWSAQLPCIHFWFKQVTNNLYAFVLPYTAKHMPLVIWA